MIIKNLSLVMLFEIKCSYIYIKLYMPPIDKGLMTIWHQDTLNNIETGTLVWIFFSYQVEIPQGHL